MQNGLKTEIQRVAVLVLALLLLGLYNGKVLVTLLIGIVLYMIWIFHHIYNLYRWLNSNRRSQPPDALGGVWGDITDQLYSLQTKHALALETQRNILKRVRSVTSALDEGLVLLNSQLEIDWWNPAAKRLLGLQKSDQNQPITNLLRTPKFVKYIHNRSFSKNLEMKSPLNQQISLLFSAALYDNNNIALVIKDISSLRQMEQMRTDFVANVSHELRTPLTVLSGYIETLQDNSSGLPPAWLKPLAQMEQQTTRMSTLANDLSLLSNIEARDPKRPTDQVKLRPLLEQITKDAKTLVSEGHSIELDCPQDIRLQGDQGELYSTFSNLVINALKHNPDGCNVRIEAEDDGKAIIVNVSDDGIGIDSKHIGRLTERFYKVDKSRSGKAGGGSGLGLAIVKHIVMRHHGTLSIKSKPGQGCTFSCRFAH